VKGEISWCVWRGGGGGADWGKWTVDEGVEDESAVFFDEVVDVAEDAAGGVLALVCFGLLGWRDLPHGEGGVLETNNMVLLELLGGVYLSCCSPVQRVYVKVHSKK